jgi:hypothetical protein
MVNGIKVGDYVMIDRDMRSPVYLSGRLGKVFDDCRYADQYVLSLGGIYQPVVSNIPVLTPDLNEKAVELYRLSPRNFRVIDRANLPEEIKKTFEGISEDGVLNLAVAAEDGELDVIHRDFTWTQLVERYERHLTFLGLDVGLGKI